MSELAVGDCGVCIGGDYGDGEPAEFFTTKVVKARKPHKCCECRRPISAGSHYRKETGKFDGEIFSFETCMVCDELKRCLSCDGPPPAFECLWEEIVDYVFPRMTTGCLQKLETAAAKSYLVERWNEWKFKLVRRAQ
jgi:hypothetical protein